MFAAGAPGAAAHASSDPCPASQFTENGTFDTAGYLACLAQNTTTGSDSMRLIAVASGMVVVGGGAVLASRMGRLNERPA